MNKGRLQGGGRRPGEGTMPTRQGLLDWLIRLTSQIVAAVLVLLKIPTKLFPARLPVQRPHTTLQFIECLNLFVVQWAVEGGQFVEKSDVVDA